MYRPILRKTSYHYQNVVLMYPDSINKTKLYKQVTGSSTEIVTFTVYTAVHTVWQFHWTTLYIRTNMHIATLFLPKMPKKQNTKIENCDTIRYSHISQIYLELICWWSNFTFDIKEWQICGNYFLYVLRVGNECSKKQWSNITFLM